jgi:hypothetical protein
MRTTPYSRAFSRVELSIVLVIVGLLVGGVLAGRSLIRASELRAVSTEFQRYQTATLAFRDKYFALPGDFGQATSFWGRMNSNADCVTNSSASVSGAGVCDGDADNALSPAASAGGVSEVAQLWRHLATAGLLEGTYSGVAAAGGPLDCVIGTDCPASEFPEAGWGIRNIIAGDSVAFSLDYPRAFVFGAQHPSNMPYAAALRAEEAWSIDTKLDDAMPAKGKIIVRYWNDCSTASSNTDYEVTYALDNSGIACALWFRNAF